MIKRNSFDKYKNKTELEKLKIFLKQVDFYSKLLKKGIPVKNIYESLESRFINYITTPEIFDDMVDRMDNKNFNYEDEEDSIGVGIEIDALAYACEKSNTSLSGIKELIKRSKKMKVRK